MQKFTVTNRNTGEQCTCNEGEFLLQALCKGGMGKHGCNGGGCGICKVYVESGPYKVVKRMSRAHVTKIEETTNTALACCIVPHGDLIIGWTENEN